MAVVPHQASLDVSTRVHYLAGVGADQPPGGGHLDEPGAFGPELDDDIDEFLAAWDEADRDAVAVLRRALDGLRGDRPPEGGLAVVARQVREGLRGRGHPFGWIRQAAGLEAEAFPDDDVELLLRCAACTISPREETGLDAEEEAILLSLEHADWLGAIVTVARDGPGADASPDALVDGIRTCPEVELASELDLDDETHLEAAFWIVALPWQVLGLTDRDQRLTLVGAWVLPRALARAWGADFDANQRS